MKVIALIVSGGEGKRFDKKLPKQFFKINKISILEQSVKKFINSNLFDKIVVVCNGCHINGEALVQGMLRQHCSSLCAQGPLLQSNY